MRCFIAIQIPSEIKVKLLDIQKEISKTGKYTFVEPKQMHLTLKFLGEVDEARIESIIRRLKSLELKPFNMTIKGLGHFKSGNFVKVIWAGIDDGGNASCVNKEINDVLTTNEDKEYNPHLTLARVKECDEKALAALEERYKDANFGTVSVDSFILYKSILTTEGAIHEEIERFSMG